MIFDSNLIVDQAHLIRPGGAVAALFACSPTTRNAAAHLSKCGTRPQNFACSKSQCLFRYARFLFLSFWRSLRQWNH